MNDIDKKLDEILNMITPYWDELSDGDRVIKSVMSVGGKDLVAQEIKQLFQELIDEVAKDFKPELIDMAHPDYHPEIAPGFSIGFNLAKQLITDRTKKLLENK